MLLNISKSFVCRGHQNQHKLKVPYRSFKRHKEQRNENQLKRIDCSGNVQKKKRKKADGYQFGLMVILTGFKSSQLPFFLHVISTLTVSNLLI